jgi:hypothetical protein
MPEEEILNAAPSIHVETSAQFGRGTGDGTLAVTNSRIVHIYINNNFNSRGFAFSRLDIANTKKSRIIIPLQSNLKISGNTNDIPWTHNFYLGNRFLDEVLKEL